ncbi:IS4 family transposase [Mucilaginibacter myungsuensis]|uniref:IS4 family transposase n=1 Tax=Mucilaginibacter myungsuensis TaxID=649104 RepID=A0A929PZS0_9SPHI|nr:IS4 family transposase [Mucilaginibacter myungsuensis]MBE9664717.1 IS4 family transposase [Mucilaginibacter myungsuensis]MDN3601426.1 IS4 family transposase [Mucilaginibacter myungsuensis]
MSLRNFRDLADKRLVSRGNKILSDLFSKSVSSVRQLSDDEASAKGHYRFLQNERVSEEDIVRNMMHNCIGACRDRYVVCIQDTTEINLYAHRGRIKKDEYIGTTNGLRERGLGFYLHPSLVLDAENGTPYGFAHVKLWSRNGEFKDKKARNYQSLPIEEKESYKWLEVSERTISALSEVVPGMVIIQDREGDIYEQFARIPGPKTDLLVRAKADRTLKDEAKLFAAVAEQEVRGTYQVTVEARNGRKKRVAQIEIRYTEVEINNPKRNDTTAAPSLKLSVIEAKETGYDGEDAICWRLLTTIEIKDVQHAMLCIEWYSWRWTIEEVFKILKKEGYHIEASELEYASSIRKQSLMIMEVCIKLFLMRLAYAEPELEISADSCFDTQQQEVLEAYSEKLEGKTQKQKNPYNAPDLKRYVWVLARLGGWKGYESYKNPGITTLWIGLGRFNDAMEAYCLHKDVSTR